MHGWREVGETVSQAFRSGDMKAMTQAVPDELVDAIAITGRPNEVRDQLAQWEGLTDQVLLYPPTVGSSADRTRENVTRIIETFGPS